MPQISAFQFGRISDALLYGNRGFGILGEQGRPRTLHSDALLIDLAGRQRMLAERMLKDVCLISSGINIEAAQQDLRETSKLFEDTLNALRNGLESVGVRDRP